MVLSVGWPVTVTCEVMSKETPISSAELLSCVKPTFWMAGRPSIGGLMEFAGSTRDSAMENAAGWYSGDAGCADVTVAGVELSLILVDGSTPRWPAKYAPPAMITTAAACASHRAAGRR